MLALVVKAWSALVRNDWFWQRREGAHQAEAVERNALKRRLRELEHR